MSYLARAGFDPQGMPNFFECFFRSTAMAEAAHPAMLVDHPVTSERIAEARNRAEQMERPQHLEDSINFGLIQERAAGTHGCGRLDLRGYYAGRVNMRDPPLAALVRSGPGVRATQSSG